jgi:hypothetical protein
MNRREAKTCAYQRAASLIESALANGWEDVERLYGDDADKVYDALNELAANLARRGGIAFDPPHTARRRSESS